MGLIARNIETPSKIFFYHPKASYKNYVVLKISSKKGDIKPGEIYEFSLPTDEGIKKYLGKVKHLFGNNIVLTIISETVGGRKFNRLVLKDTYIPVGIFVEKEEKPFVGILRDFSLSGFKVKFSPKDYTALKKIYNEAKAPPYTKALFRIPGEKETYEVDIIPARFDDEENTVAFSYTFNEKNINILKIYEKLAKKI